MKISAIKFIRVTSSVLYGIYQDLFNFDMVFFAARPDPGVRVICIWSES